MKRRSRKRLVFEGIEGLAVLAGASLSWPVSRRWLKNWGSTAAERAREWPGDSLIEPNIEGNTRAITIDAPASHVWSWLVGFGLGRAGFFSYELLERLVGIPATNLESIDPAFDSLEVGDEIFLHPSAAIRVARIERNRHICFGADPEADRGLRPALDRTWSVYVEPLTDDSCRLVIRGLYEQTGPRRLLERLAFAVEQSIDFVMEQRMLRTLKRLAEAKAISVSSRRAQP